MQRFAAAREPLILGALAASATVALHLRDPHQHGSWGVCPTYAIAGVYCPFCGGLRAVNDLTRGDWLAAAHSNLLLVEAGPVVIVLYLAWLVTSLWGKPRKASLPRGAWVVLTVSALAFAVVRNLPIGTALRP